MKNQLTELVFILDRSGSMAGLESDTIGGFNSMLRKQQQEGGQVYVSTVVFDNHSTVIHDRVPILKVSPMTERDYTVGGCTALLDAIGDAIHHIGNIHKYARPEDVPGQTLFIITTDGQENASQRYDAFTVKRMVMRQQRKYGWKFIFLGANIDAITTADQIGIAPEFAVNYRSDSHGTQLNYQAMSEAITELRSARPMSANWRKSVDEDYQNRDST